MLQFDKQNNVQGRTKRVNMVVYSTETVNHIGPESWNLLLNDHKYQPLLSLRKLRLIKIKINLRLSQGNVSSKTVHANYIENICNVWVLSS